MKKLLFFTLLAAVFALGCYQQSNKNKAAASAQAIANKPKDTLIFADTALSDLVKRTYHIFKVWDTISLGVKYDIRKLNFNKNELTTIQQFGEDGVTPKDSVALRFMFEGVSLSTSFDEMVSGNLVKILNWKNINKYNLSLLLNPYLIAARSTDGRLYNFSYDQKTGGTYRSRTSVTYYTPSNSSKSAIISVDSDTSAFVSDGYSTIDTIPTKKGTAYILNGGVIGCSTCMGSYITMVHFENGKFVRDFQYDFTSRMEEDGETGNIGYDAKAREIFVSYLTDDETPSCNCGPNGTLDYNEMHNNPEYPFHSEVNCWYRFNGHTFKLKKKKIKINKHPK